MAAFGSSKNGLCANNCGFYGNPKNQNLCSVCFAAAAFLKETDEDSKRRKISSNDVVRDKEEAHLGKRRSPSATESSETSESTSESMADLMNSAPKIRNRCRICKKKIGLLGFDCQCGDLFCGKHRLPETHSCYVNYKVIDRMILAKQIVQCKADKLEFRI